MARMTMSIATGRISIHRDAPAQKITIKRSSIPNDRLVYQGSKLIATIHDHRGSAKAGSKADRFSTIQDNWNVCWLTGRVDWHGTYAEARDNALKGQ